MKVKITSEKQPCRKCGGKLTRREHAKPTNRKANYYFAWFFKCTKCRAVYMVEEAKRPTQRVIKQPSAFKWIADRERQVESTAKPKTNKQGLAKSKWKCVLAQTMRDFPTPCEKLIAPIMVKMGFISQPIVLGYIPDFANFSSRIIVEIDGSVHSLQNVKNYDAQREENLRAHGWKILRFSNNLVESQPSFVYKQIKSALEKTNANGPLNEYGRPLVQKRRIL